MPIDERRIGAEVHVVGEVSVRDDVKQPSANDAREEHREPEIDDDVAVLSDAARPQNASRGREKESGDQKNEVRGKRDAESRKKLRPQSFFPSSGGAGGDGSTGFSSGS